MDNGTYIAPHIFDDLDDATSKLMTRILPSLVNAFRSDPDAWLALFQALSVTNYTGDHPYTAGVEVGINAEVNIGIDAGARLTAQHPLFLTSATSSMMQMAQCDDLASALVLIDKQPDNIKASVHSPTIKNPNPKSGGMRNMRPCKECKSSRTKVCPLHHLCSVTFLLPRTSSLYLSLLPISTFYI